MDAGIDEGLSPLPSVKSHLGTREPLATTVTPTEQELRLLREEVDPHRYLIGRG
jgi:hypothetical protein